MTPETVTATIIQFEKMFLFHTINPVHYTKNLDQVTSLVLLFASDVVCLSGYDLFLSPFNSFVAPLCTFSKHSISFFRYGDQTWTHYSRCGRT